jgi:hypothetical protein
VLRNASPKAAGRFTKAAYYFENNPAHHGLCVQAPLLIGKRAQNSVMARLVLILLLHGLLFAQTPAVVDPLGDASLIEKGLQSAIPLQVAISAFRSVSINDGRRGEWLRAALSKSTSLQPEGEALRSKRAIFDALIRTRTTVPLTELLPFFDQFPAAVIAVVAKGRAVAGEDRLPLLLKAEETKNSAYWYAAAALMDRKQLIHRLVQQARFDYAISVVDQDFIPVQVSGGPPEGITGGIPGGAMNGFPNGSQVAWPEETVYHIEMSGGIDHILTCCVGGNTYLKAWSTTLHAFKDAQPADLSAWEDQDREVVRVLLSFSYCRTCQFSRGDFPNVRGGKATIVWRSEEQTRSLLEEAVEQYVKECVRMVGALGETALSETDIRSKVRIWVRDWRQVRTIPIPGVGAGVEFNRCASIQHTSSNGRCID